MAEIIQFVPKAECDARQNLQGFIDMCRYQLTTLGADLEWEANYWDITRLIIRRGAKGPFAFIYGNFDTAGGRAEPVPMARPFLDFAKAYMRYQHSLRPTTGYNTRMVALRALEKALCECSEDGVPRVEKTDPQVLYRAAKFLEDKNPRSAYQSANQLKIIADFLVKFKLTTVPFIWKNPVKRQEEHNNQVGQKSAEARKAKMPSVESLQALAQAFAVATDPIDHIITSIAALMMCAPDRINEVLRLPVLCEDLSVYKGKEKYGLRWWSSKGADPMVKPVISTMVETAKNAVRRLREQTEEARRIAFWYENNRTSIYLPKHLEHLRDSEYLATREVCEVVGFANNSAACRWATDYKVRFIKEERPSSGTGRPGNLYRFDDIERVVIKMLPDDFPVYDRETKLKYSDALCLVPRYFFHQDRSACPCMFETITTNLVNIQLGAGEQADKTSIFSRLGLYDEDGNLFRIRSHQFRHFLNTLAQRKHVDQMVIAMWSGRKDSKQNRAYDNRTPEEILELLRDGNVAGEVAEIVPKMPLTREQYLELKYPTVHTTPYGFCVHHWTMLPCQRQRACLDCTEHVCIKGDAQKTDRIRQCLRDAEEHHERDLQAQEEGWLHADRWFEFNRKKVERLSNLMQIFEDSSVPEGTIIQMTNDNEYSPIEVALNDRQLLGDRDGALLGQVRALNAVKAVTGGVGHG